LNPLILKSKLEDNLNEKNEIFSKVYGHREYSFDATYQDYLNFGKKIKPFVADTVLFLNEEMDKKRSVLFEGAQGTFLDIDFGTYTFVTSSNSIVGGVCAGCGVPPTKIDKSIAAVKAYTTRVGEGPFPTEFSKKLEEEIRAKGKEFGATTGRPRRCGWFDSVLARYSVILNGISELAIMKLDVLDELKTIKICTGYQYKDEVYKNFPMDFELLCKAKPVYEEVPGWNTPTRGMTRFDELPANAQKYLNYLEKLLKVRIRFVSTGSKRDEMIIRF